MKHSETLIGHRLIERFEELKARDVLFIALKCGSTNAEWILEWHEDEQPKEEQTIMDGL